MTKMNLQVTDVNDTVLYEAQADSIAQLLYLAVKDGANLDGAYLRGANLDGANLRGAYLRGANLDSANLDGANLDGAYLRGANLRGANLDGANLDGANLGRAYLRGAYLRGANLDSANLRGAYLRGANLDSANLRGANLGGATIIETGERWEQYLSTVVPALLTAGGKALSDVLAANAWECHSWANCPIAEAFSTHSIDGVPLLLLPRAEQFIRYFDARLIPLEAVGKVDQ